MSEPEHIDLTVTNEEEAEKESLEEEDDETPSISLEVKEPPKLKRRMTREYDLHATRVMQEEKRASSEKHFQFLEVTQRTSQRTPAAVFKFDQELFGFFEITPNVELVRLLKARFMSKRLRELASLGAMSWSALSDLVDSEWETVDRDLRAGHIIFAIWKMMCYCGRTEELL